MVSCSSVSHHKAFRLLEAEGLLKSGEFWARFYSNKVATISVSSLKCVRHPFTSVSQKNDTICIAYIHISNAMNLKIRASNAPLYNLYTLHMPVCFAESFDLPRKRQARLSVCGHHRALQPPKTQTCTRALAKPFPPNSATDPCAHPRRGPTRLIRRRRRHTRVHAHRPLRPAPTLAAAPRAHARAPTPTLSGPRRTTQPTHSRRGSSRPTTRRRGHWRFRRAPATTRPGLSADAARPAPPRQHGLSGPGHSSRPDTPRKPGQAGAAPPRGHLAPRSPRPAPRPQRRRWRRAPPRPSRHEGPTPSRAVPLCRGLGEGRPGSAEVQASSRAASRPRALRLGAGRGAAVFSPGLARTAHLLPWVSAE